MEKEVRTPQYVRVIMLVAFLTMVVIIFIQQMKVPFMLEDLDYAKNLVTGEPLSNLSDIENSLGCIYYWKGGSLLAGLVLQLILMAGGYFADVVNMLVMIACSLLLFAPTKAKHQRIFFTVYSFLLLICLNADWNNSYFRQFGAVNFFYPSLLMLTVVTICSKIIDDPEKYEHIGFGRAFSLSAASLIAGIWAPMYGIISAVSIGAVIWYRSHSKVAYRSAGLITALFFSCIGSILYFTCPGNYVENSVMLTTYINADVYPSVVLALMVLAIFLKMGGKLKPSQYLLCGIMMTSAAILLFCVLLLPISPNGALLCTMVLGISTFCSLFSSLNNLATRYRAYAYILCAIVLLYDVFVLLESQLGVE